MAAEKFLSTQASILIAGALIAAGLFFGLRGREPAPLPAAGPTPPAAPSAASTSAASPPASSPAPPAAPPPPAPTATADRAAATAAATKDLERYRAEIVKKCVQPALAKKPDPPQIKLTFNVTFDAQGKQITRGVAEDRATMREGVTMCAMDAIPPLEIPPQGISVYVELPWTLP